MTVSRRVCIRERATRRYSRNTSSEFQECGWCGKKRICSYVLEARGTKENTRDRMIVVCFGLCGECIVMTVKGCDCEDFQGCNHPWKAPFLRVIERDPGYHARYLRDDRSSAAYTPKTVVSNFARKPEMWDMIRRFEYITHHGHPLERGLGPLAFYDSPEELYEPLDGSLEHGVMVTSIFPFLRRHRRRHPSIPTKNVKPGWVSFEVLCVTNTPAATARECGYSLKDALYKSGM